MRIDEAFKKTMEQRLNNISRDLSGRTLRLMEDIIAEDIRHDEEHGICYECEAEGGAA